MTDQQVAVGDVVQSTRHGCWSEGVIFTVTALQPWGVDCQRSLRGDRQILTRLHWGSFRNLSRLGQGASIRSRHQ